MSSPLLHFSVCTRFLRTLRSLGRAPDARAVLLQREAAQFVDAEVYRKDLRDLRPLRDLAVRNRTARRTDTNGSSVKKPVSC